MSKDPVCVRTDQKISDVWQILSQGRVHHLPVIEEDRLVGIISTLDLAKLGICPLEDGQMLAREFLDTRLSVGQVMQRNVISISDRASVRDAARMLSAGGFHGLPVVNEGKRLVGIVTSTDLIAYLLDVLSTPAALAAAGGIAPHEHVGASRAGAHADTSEAKLHAVLRAAEVYLRSGQGEREHASLERAVEAARDRRDVHL
jgi:CBS domain-containing protein